MKFMNEYDRTGAIYRFARSGLVPNRLALAYVVDDLATWTDNHSDGWAYWPKPCRAAAKAIALIESTAYPEYERREREDITAAELAAALRPIKAFLTRQGVSDADRAEILRAVQS